MVLARSVVAVGGCGVGLSFSVDNFPSVGETILSSSLEYVNGGKAANHAVGLTQLGVPTALISARGQDDMGDRVGKLLTERGVDQSGMLVNNGATMVGALFIDFRGENIIVVAPGALNDLSVDSMRERREILQSASLAVVSLEIPLGAAAEALQIVRDAGGCTIVNLSPCPNQEWTRKILAVSDIVVLNQVEAQEATGAAPKNEPAELASILLKHGPKAVVITLGGRGAIVATREHTVHRPASHTDTVFDTSGAGDAFLCGVVAGLHNGLNLSSATDLGSELAGLILRGRGFVESLEHWEDAKFPWTTESLGITANNDAGR